MMARVCWWLAVHVCSQGNVVAGSAPGSVDPSLAINPDGQPVTQPPAVTTEMDKEHAETLLQVNACEAILLAVGCVTVLWCGCQNHI